MDALSDVLRVVRLTGGVFLDAEFTAPWCVTAKVAPEDCRPFLADPAHVIAYHYVVAGRLFLQVEDDPPTQVRAGEIVLLPRNHAHRLGSSLTLRRSVPTTSSGLRAKADSLASATGEPTHIVCGFLGSAANHNPLVAALPKVLKLISAAGQAATGWRVRFNSPRANCPRVGPGRKRSCRNYPSCCSWKPFAATSRRRRLNRRDGWRDCAIGSSGAHG